MMLVVLLVLVGCGGGTDYDTFRQNYVAAATYNDKFRDPPPELTDEQVDEAIRRVCVDGEPNLDKADEIGESLAGGVMGSSTLGAAIYQGVKAVGCG